MFNPRSNPLSNEEKPVSCTPNNVKKVSSAEKCTMDMAKMLGIDDPIKYFKDEYSTIKTFNPDVDSKDSQKFNKLCYQSIVKPSESYVHCLIQHGPGFRRKQGDPSKCITSECPPGFESLPGGCKKVAIPGMVLKHTRCDERWYDWFTIPNYHLGNKYQHIDGTCMEPCKPNYVPGYVKDPIDEATLDYSTKEDLSTCVHKYNYFGGKYRDSTDFCPIAMVKQLGTSKQELIQEYQKALSDVPNRNEHGSKIENDISVLIDELYKTIQQNVTDTDMLTGERLNACRKLHTETRLAETYSICKNVMENSDMFMDKFIKDGIEPEIASKKMMILKKACHNLFCNKNDDAGTVVAEKVWPPNSCKPDDPTCPNRLSGEPLCFKEVESVNLENQVADIKKNKTDELPVISAETQKNKINRSFKWMIYFIIVPVYLVILYGLFTQLIWPYLLRPLIRIVWRTIQYLLTGFKTSRRQDIIEDQIQELREIQGPKRTVTNAVAKLGRKR